MNRWIAKYEALLRIPADCPEETLMRLRAIWVIGWLFVCTQIFNMTIMSISYGKWTYDHWIALIAMTLVAISIHALRWHKDFLFYARFYSLLLLAGMLGSALPEHTGINSALVPFLTMGPLINGYIAGRRAAIGYAVLAFLILCLLYWVTLSHPPVFVEGGYERETNRFAQACFALIMSTVMSSMLAEQAHSALVTMRANAERASNAEAAKSRFLATMSHELRTPLNGVIGLTDALIAGDLPEREKSITRTIRQSGESLLLILNDLLDLSKIEAGKLAIDPRPCDPTEIVRSATDSWRETAAAKDLSLTIEIDPELPSCFLVDDLRLRQIVHNLVSNAIKFTTTGTVHVSAKVDDEARRPTLALRVTDSGRGVPPELADRIFEAFEQGERGTTRQYGGTGLGLPICRMLAELMGGSIRIEATSPAGTTFLLTLPIVEAVREDEASAPDNDADGTIDLNGIKVLVAEDNLINRLVVGEFLKGWGVDFDIAEDGQYCLEMLEIAEYDVILMDKHMPRLNGVDATRMIRASDKAYRSIPIVALTADAMAGEREAVLAAGMNAFLTKPIRGEELGRTLRDVVVAAKRPKAANAA